MEAKVWRAIVVVAGIMTLLFVFRIIIAAIEG